MKLIRNKDLGAADVYRDNSLLRTTLARVMKQSRLTHRELVVMLYNLPLTYESDLGGLPGRLEDAAR